MKMLEALKRAFASRRHAEEQTAAQKYEALVKEALAGKLEDEKSVDRVEKILAECGRTLQQLEADCARHKEMAELERIAAPLDDLAIECKNLVLDRAKLQREYDAAVAEYKKKFPELEKRLSHTQTRRQEAARAAEELAHRFPAESNIGQLWTMKNRRTHLVEQIEYCRHKLNEPEFEIRNCNELIAQEKKNNQHAPKQMAEKIEGLERRLAHFTRERDALLKDIANGESEIASIDAKSKELAKVAA